MLNDNKENDQRKQAEELMKKFQQICDNTVLDMEADCTLEWEKDLEPKLKAKGLPPVLMDLFKEIYLYGVKIATSKAIEKGFMHMVKRIEKKVKEEKA